MYERLHNEQPGFTKKVFPVHGDILEPGFGIKPTDLELLNKNVNVVIHSAATIRFDEPLRLVYSHTIRTQL